MHHYKIALTPELEKAYQQIAQGLDMSMEQVLFSAVQIYAEKLTLQPYDCIYTEKRVSSPLDLYIGE